MARAAKTWRARSMGSVVRRRRPCPTRRSTCTRISAEVPRSASRTAAAMASRSASVNTRRAQPGWRPSITSLRSRRRRRSCRRRPRTLRRPAAAPRAATTTAAPDDRRLRAPAAAVDGVAAPLGVPDRRQHRHGEDAEDQAQERDRRGAEPRRGTASGGLRRRPAADPREHRVHRGVEAGGVALLAEARRDRVADDRGRHDVGDHRLEAVADLDPQLALLQEDDEHDAVVDALAADLPLFGEADGDVFQALALERGEDRDDHLRAGGALAVGQLALEPLAVGGGQDAGLVVDARGGRRGKGEGEGEDDAEEQPRTSLWAPSRRRAPPRRTAWAGNRASRPRDFPG